MKAAQNGVLNVSVLDGWWDEGFEGDNGWAIGGRETDPDEAAQDWRDAQDLYRILEEEIVPSYYERDAARAADPLAGGHAPGDGDGPVALLHDPDAPRVHRAALPAGRRRHGGHDRPRVGRDRSRITSPGMPPRISLALAIHNHQPVGNFGWVFAEVFEQAYQPMVAALERHPQVRLSLHYSGPLLEWLRAERPEFIDRLAGAGGARPGRDPGRRPLRAGARLAAGARPDRTGAPDGR